MPHLGRRLPRPSALSMKSSVTRRATRALYVGRTIADFEGADLIDTPHIAEALQYRKREGD